MAHIGCPCGNRLSNSGDYYDLEYYFISNDVLQKHWEDMAFFEIQYSDLRTEIWKCDICDRMLVFDNDTGKVAKYMKQVEAEGVPTEHLERPHVKGLCYNNLVFNATDWHFTFENEYNNGPEYVFFERRDSDEDKPLLTPKIMFEEIFNIRSCRFMNWWYASMYDDYLVFYSPYREEWDKPVRAWKCYERTKFGKKGKPGN